MNLVRSWGLIGCGGLCERKWSPGQPVFLNYASGELVMPLIKEGNLENGNVLCGKLVSNKLTFEPWWYQSEERPLERKEIRICHVPGTLSIVSHLTVRTTL